MKESHSDYLSFYKALWPVEEILLSLSGNTTSSFLVMKWMDEWIDLMVWLVIQQLYIGKTIQTCIKLIRLKSDRANSYWGHSASYLTSSFLNCQGHKSQGKSSNCQETRVTWQPNAMWHLRLNPGKETGKLV